MSRGTKLTAESDLNSITAFGNYYCARTSDAQAIKNKPPELSAAFSMKIIAGNGTEYPTQFIIDINGIIYLRTRIGGDTGWRKWKVIDGISASQ